MGCISSSGLKDSHLHTVVYVWLGNKGLDRVSYSHCRSVITELVSYSIIIAHISSTLASLETFDWVVAT